MKDVSVDGQVDSPATHGSVAVAEAKPRGWCSARFTDPPAYVYVVVDEPPRPSPIVTELTTGLEPGLLVLTKLVMGT
jgi:hypothetical protein